MLPTELAESNQVLVAKLPDLRAKFTMVQANHLHHFRQSMHPITNVSLESINVVLLLMQVFGL